MGAVATGGRGTQARGRGDAAAPPGVDVNGFSDVDASGEVDALVAYLDRAHCALGPLHRRVRECLDLRPGDAVLDVGCGAGHELVALADEGARVVGVDLSAGMLAAGAARLAGAGRAAALAQADAARLPFADGSFDAVRVERVLQHVPDPAAVVAEVRRVLRPGGVGAVVEPDWTSLTLASQDPAGAAAVAGHASATVRNRDVGRHLRRLLVDAGLADVRVDVEVAVYTSVEELGLAASLDRAAECAWRSGDLDRDRAERLLDEQRLLSARGAFHATLNRDVLAWGRRAGA